VIDPDAEWRTWREWLGVEPTGQTIYAEVVEMLSFRKIWQGFAMIHDAAPEQARKNATFVLWLRWNYARSMGSAIRRQTDVRDDVVSLGRLIDRVWRYPTVLTRTRFVNMQGIDEADVVNGWFDDLAGTVTTSIPRSLRRTWRTCERRPPSCAGGSTRPSLTRTPRDATRLLSPRFTPASTSSSSCSTSTDN
jgi:hypothetical protein